MKTYFLYARKSSESEDRQVLSIDSQIKELQDLAKRHKIKIVDILTESKSAKAPGRPIFGELVQRINNGEAQGVICWKLDRLARNAVDGGSIIWLVKDLGIEIVTPSQTYSHISENSFMMYIEFGMAQKFIDDLGKNAKRGMKTKAEMGWYPAPAPIGYRNTPDRKKGFKVIEKDVSFPLVRELFDEVLSGSQPIKVWSQKVNKGHLLGKNGRQLSRSGFYFLLTNPFYFGEFEWPKGSGNWFDGKHEPMITRDEFDMVQKMLGRHGKPIARSHVHDLTGLMRCAECGCAITATKKVKYYKRTDRFAEYTYYHCSRKHKTLKCKQPPISESDLIGISSELLVRLRLKQEFIDWARKWLKALHEKESTISEAGLESQHIAVEKIENKLNRLLDMRLDDKLTEEAYEEKKRELESEKQRLSSKLREIHQAGGDWRRKIEDSMDFAYAACHRFNTGTREDKHEVLLRIGSNLLLENKKIRLDLKKFFKICSEQDVWEVNKYKEWLEPQEYADIMGKNPSLRPIIPAWLPDVDSNHGP